MRQQRIFAIIVIFLIVKQLESKALKSDINPRVKRGYGGYGGNAYDSTLHVSSSVLQYDKAPESSSIEFEVPAIQHEDPWRSSGLSSGYEVWLEPSTSYHPVSSLPDIHTSITSSHPASDILTNSVFSEHSDQFDHHELPASQLHTQIISSSGISSSGHGISDHSVSTVSDNIDFNNVSDIESKHYAKSYGK